MERNKDEVVEVLNRIVELELAGAVRYTQYSMMVFGHARIPIVSWMREKAAEALLHATEAEAPPNKTLFYQIDDVWLACAVGRFFNSEG